MGRYKLNQRLGLDIDLETRTLTHDDIIALVRELITLPVGCSRNARGRGRPIPYRTTAAEALSLPSVSR